MRVLTIHCSSQCPNGCADWTNVQSPNYNQSFINGTFIDIAGAWLLLCLRVIFLNETCNLAAQPGTMCAMPGASAGDHECDCSDKSEVITGKSVMLHPEYYEHIKRQILSRGHGVYARIQDQSVSTHNIMKPLRTLNIGRTFCCLLHSTSVWYFFSCL